MGQLGDLEQKIEAKRNELNLAYRVYGLLSETVLKLSIELDKLLNAYYELTLVRTA
ncbi:MULTISPECIES: aspartyl-phosphate phosphatase Spo0E family protein [Paenibacillus]|uniref:Aspartyl-phosphate phosphatase Spo0E family protein n=1 Tax=Paenibacillus whitsoniae TaxID=2496558 RepID=A0A3S0BMC0_9BACL|nr:aspartyl-phosphate phosphatase Spo0E family protein [Paenibacillus whitsoniae]RTE09794.1 aspartyl-phosphate phosphatase Spo0E family protein [Paenibacillus whitsoniae]